MAADKEKKSMLAGYTKILRHVPDQPEVLKFIKRGEKQIVINTAARRDAKIIKLE